MGFMKIQGNKKLVWTGLFKESFKEVRLKGINGCSLERSGLWRHSRLKKQHRQRREACEHTEFSLRVDRAGEVEGEKVIICP